MPLARVKGFIWPNLIFSSAIWCKNNWKNIMHGTKWKRVDWTNWDKGKARRYLKVIWQLHLPELQIYQANVKLMANLKILTVTSKNDPREYKQIWVAKSNYMHRATKAFNCFAEIVVLTKWSKWKRSLKSIAYSTQLKI